MTSIAHWVLRNKLIVGAFWILLTFIGALLVSLSTSRLTFDFSLPNQPGQQAAQAVRDIYGNSAEDGFMLVVTSENGSRLDDAAVAQTFAAVQQSVPTARVVGKAQTDNNPVFSTEDGSSQFAYAFTPPSNGFSVVERDPLSESLAANAPQGTTTALTGSSELAAGEGGEAGPGLLIEVLLGGLGALAVLLFVFASFLALLPLFVAAVSILTTFLVLLGVTYLTDVSFIVQFLVALVGLGVAIDYSLIIVNRWREECTAGKPNEESIVIAMKHAGHAVVFSGLTVAISLFSLVILPVPFLRSVGIGGLLIPLVSVAVVITLLPAILGAFGPKVDWPRVRKTQVSSFWLRWGRGVVKRPVVAALAAAAILIVLTVPALSIHIGNPDAESLASSGPAHDSLRDLRDGGVPFGAVTPIEVLASSDAVGSVVDTASRTPGAAAAMVEANTTGDSGLALVIPEAETSSINTVGVIRSLQASFEDNVDVRGVSGIGAFILDFQRSVYGNFPYALAAVCLITYVLLARAFRSLLLPLKAVALNIASLAATFGALTLVWQEGYGSSLIWGIEGTGAITFWVPIMLFAFLFGLSMDYEVFIISRMREEFDKHGSTNRAVIEGLGHTGRLVTSAALILFLAFVALASGPQTDIKVVATGLGIGILLDATVIRMLLVPALISLFGNWNWYMPDWAARILRIKPLPKENEKVIDLREPARKHVPLHSAGRKSLLSFIR